MSEEMNSARIRVLIGSPIEEYLVDRIMAVDPRLEVIYRPDLLGKPRHYADHTPLAIRAPEQETEWAALMARAEVMFDAYRPSSENLPQKAPRLRWIQFTSSGVTHLVQQMGLADSQIIVTNVAGIHATPLAEFVLLAMLYFAKDLPRAIMGQRQHRWQRFAADTVRGKTAGIVGLGRVGSEVARLARAVGVRVIATKRSTEQSTAAELGVDELIARKDLTHLLAQSDYLVICVPATDETNGMIGERELEAMKPEAVLINVSRGSVVDEPALIRALSGQRLKGAALDVFATEPLPPDSPLWDLPNVLVTPHSMSTAAGENDLVVDIFCDNLRRYLDGRPLRNVFDRVLGY